MSLAPSSISSTIMAEKKANGYVAEAGEPALLPGTRQESTWKPNEVWGNGAKTGIAV